MKNMNFSSAFIYQYTKAPPNPFINEAELSKIDTFSLLFLLFIAERICMLVFIQQTVYEFLLVALFAISLSPPETFNISMSFSCCCCCCFIVLRGKHSFEFNQFYTNTARTHTPLARYSLWGEERWYSTISYLTYIQAPNPHFRSACLRREVFAVFGIINAMKLQ